MNQNYADNKSQMLKREISTGPRLGAMILDHIIMSSMMGILMIPIIISNLWNNFEDHTSDHFFSADWIFYLMVFSMSLYFNKDVFQGQSIAKRVLKQRIVQNDSGETSSPLRCLIRNLTILIWPIEVIVVMISPTRRIGDFMAGTRVEYISYDRSPAPKADYKQILISLFLGFLILLAVSTLFYSNIYKGFSPYPEYVASSCNKELSDKLEDHLMYTQSAYISEVHIKVYDTILNDSLKYIAAAFYFNQNYIENKSAFKAIKPEIFNSIFEIISKEEFILFGKFIYNGNYNRQATWQIYDWRETYTDY